jgi:hypothetical protein
MTAAAVQVGEKFAQHLRRNLASVESNNN